MKGQCYVVAMENLAVILGLSLADVGIKGMHVNRYGLKMMDVSSGM